MSPIPSSSSSYSSLYSFPGPSTTLPSPHSNYRCLPLLNSSSKQENSKLELDTSNKYSFLPVKTSIQREPTENAETNQLTTSNFKILTRKQETHSPNTTPTRKSVINDPQIFNADLIKPPPDNQTNYDLYRPNQNSFSMPTIFGSFHSLTASQYFPQPVLRPSTTKALHSPFYYQKSREYPASAWLPY